MTPSSENPYDDREPKEQDAGRPAAPATPEHPHRNPDRLAHDDPETEEDTASGGPA